MKLLIGLLTLVLSLTSFSLIGQPLNLRHKAVDSLKVKLSLFAEDTNRVNNLWRLARYYTMTDPRQAVEYATESISLARKIDYTYGELVSLQALSFVSTITGDWQRGMQTAYEGLQISQSKYPIRGCLL